MLPGHADWAWLGGSCGLGVSTKRVHCLGSVGSRAVGEEEAKAGAEKQRLELDALALSHLLTW